MKRPLLAVLLGGAALAATGHLGGLRGLRVVGTETPVRKLTALDLEMLAKAEERRRRKAERRKGSR